MLFALCIHATIPFSSLFLSFSCSLFLHSFFQLCLFQFHIWDRIKLGQVISIVGYIHDRNLRPTDCEKPYQIANIWEYRLNFKQLSILNSLPFTPKKKEMKKQESHWNIRRATRGLREEKRKIYISYLPLFLTYYSFLTYSIYIYACTVRPQTHRYIWL